jgi:uncharacterized protein
VPKIKAVIDTQIFLRAAINRRSLPATIVFDLRNEYQLVTSLAIVQEVRDVLHRPELRTKFSTLTDEVISQILALLMDAEMVAPSEVPAVSRDSKDDIFLACAKAADAHYIVTEDNDLLVLHPYGDIQIVNVLAFLDVVRSH